MGRIWIDELSGDLVPEERSFRRTASGTYGALAALGYLEIIQLRHPNENGEIRSISAVKTPYSQVLGRAGG